MEIIGIDIGGTKCAVVATDENGIIRKKLRFPTETERGLEYTLEQIYRAIEQVALESSALRDNPVFGVSCGGPLDSRTGVIMSPPNLPGWDNVHITGLLEQRFGGQAFLMNDANACALAEWQFGAAQGYDNAIFLTFGTGMGAGLVLDGRLYVGTNDLAGEVGHIRLAEDGPMGYGKRGSFEGFCSGGGIARLAQGAVKKTWDRGESVAFCPDETWLCSLDARTVAEAAVKGDALALEIMETSARYLGRGLSILIDILNPEVIVIGSIYARCEELMRPTMMRVIQEEALSLAAERCKIKAAGLGEEIGDYGAIAVATYGMKGVR